ncbi:hypothetical protein C8J57DRAFT_1087804, partial [Mycena rebaudengoi]
AKCLRLNHNVRTVHDTLIIATRTVVTMRKSHQVNPSGIGRKNCGCTLCYRDRTRLGCEHPGECIETAKILLDSIIPKCNPTLENPHLCDELALTNEEIEGNKCPRETDHIITFDPNFTLSNMGSGFQIFALEQSPNEMPARRVRTSEHVPDPITILCMHGFCIPANIVR